VTGLRHDDSGWSVHSVDGLVETPGNGGFAAVVLALPSPQAVPLVASAGTALPGLETVHYAPCWALMLAFSQPLGLSADRIRPYDDVIDWFARDGSKLGRSRDRETLVMHAGAEWSRQHLEWSVDSAAHEIVARFQLITGISAKPYFSAAHRWRYALVLRAAGPAFLWNEAARIGACGDWCLGPSVESAFNSGEAIAHAVLQTLEADLVV